MHSGPRTGRRVRNAISYFSRHNHARMPNNLNFQMLPLLTCVGVLITDVADIDPNFESEARNTYLDFLDHALKSNQHYSCVEELFGKSIFIITKCAVVSRCACLLRASRLYLLILICVYLVHILKLYCDVILV